MQCRAVDDRIVDLPQESLNEMLTLTLTEELTEESTVRFQTHFEGYMEMYGDAQLVAQYLNAHEGWFCRCAQPMKVEPIGNNGYILTVGKFGAFGYEVEPKIAVVLQPPQERVYLMNSIPVSNYQAPGYDVDYQASMELQEIPVELAKSDVAAVFKKHKISKLPGVITQVKWELHMDVAVQFPKFIQKLPTCLIQRTGDRLLAQIVRQISPRLTQKVQQDFHARLNLPNPPKNASSLQRISQQEDEEIAA
ncbi:DUF1997 domain-containing protein [Candidatus Gracilibacteria bacterium]|nr:DUF1997 domain-containing protein [Candidatus Gracilibacteria bacterium]NJM90484.1 DUF1997 domain-containing protein [Hydrococcus sp. RU_2_2]NJP20232.1 DUF1997 domain-containing protein [Hydrococcus sp. CRU_1_1]NJQ97418.1 DUF1997 domain-containing protein [Hydrococcus sp. CSU_1_8]